MTSRSPESNPHERSTDRELGAIDTRLDEHARRLGEVEVWQAAHDAAELAAARAIVVEARKSAADATGKHEAIVLDERKEKRSRRWDLVKLGAPALAGGVGYLLSKLHVAADWIRHFFSKGH